MKPVLLQSSLHSLLVQESTYTRCTRSAVPAEGFIMVEESTAVEDQNNPPPATVSKVLQALTQGRKVRATCWARILSLFILRKFHRVFWKVSHKDFCVASFIHSCIQQDLWNGQLNQWIAWFFDPLRDFFLDPLFAIGSHLLPPLANKIPRADGVLAFIISCNMYCMRLIYRAPTDVQDIDLRQTARQDMLVNNKAGLRIPKFTPPSDFASAFRGAVAFGTSAAADIVSVCMDRTKMAKWFETLAEFKAYLDASGVGGELEEAILKPLWRGRLLDNIKMLNDIQEEMYVDRCRAINIYSAAELQGPIQEGKRYA